MNNLILDETEIKSQILTWNLINDINFFKIKLINIFVDKSNLKLNLKLGNKNTFVIETDGKTYIYIKNDNFDMSSLNLDLFGIEHWEIIFEKLNNFMKETFNTENIKEVEFDDIFNMDNSKHQRCKGPINFLIWEKIHNELTKSHSNINKYNIPKQLLYKSNNIFNIVKKEIIKINTNFDYLHYLVPEDNNPYKLKLHLKFKKDSRLYNDMKKIKEKWDFNSVQFDISLDPQLYPFVPPNVVFCKPKIQSKLMYILFGLEPLQFNNWNPTNSLEWVVLTLANIIEDNADINIIHSSNGHEKLSYHPIEYLMFKLGNLTGEKPLVSDEIKINFKKIYYNSNKNKNGSSANKYWKSGVGYGHDNRKAWNVKEYIQKQENKNKEISDLLQKINHELTKDKITEEIVEIFENSCFINYVVNLFRGTTFMEIDKRIVVFTSVVPLIRYMTMYDNWSENLSMKIYNSLNNICEDIKIVLSNEITKSNLENKIFYEDLASIFDWWQIYIYKFNTKSDLNLNTTISDDKEKYLQIMKQFQFSHMNILNDSRHYHKNHITRSTPNMKTIKRLIKEIPSLKNNLPLSWSSTIFVKCDPNQINCLKCLIVGPEYTPYMNGMYEFDVFFPDEYPNGPPKVQLYTTGGGSVRFNPNLYNCGKVCLSLLGTWSGQGGESWIKDSSTFLQVLVSIQSLIMVDEPYFNEPGWEKQMNTPQGKKSSFEYSDNIRLQNMKWAILNQIKNPTPGFENAIKNHFKMKKNEIVQIADIWINETKKYKINMTKIKNEIIEAIDSIEI